jgi:hypothetical protein
MGGVFMALQNNSLHTHIPGLQDDLHRAGPSFNFGVGGEVYMYVQGAFQYAVYVAQGLSGVSD